MPDEEFLFHSNISKIGDEWWLEIPWAIIVCNSEESAEAELEKQRQHYREKLDRMGNPQSVIPIVEGSHFYETGMSPPILTTEEGQKITWT